MHRGAREAIIWDNGTRIPLPRPKELTTEFLRGMFLNDDGVVVGAVQCDPELEGLIVWKPDRCSNGDGQDAGPPPPPDAGEPPPPEEPTEE